MLRFPSVSVRVLLVSMVICQSSNLVKSRVVKFHRSPNPPMCNSVSVSSMIMLRVPVCPSGLVKVAYTVNLVVCSMFPVTSIPRIARSVPVPNSSSNGRS